MFAHIETPRDLPKHDRTTCTVRVSFRHRPGLVQESSGYRPGIVQASSGYFSGGLCTVHVGIVRVSFRHRPGL
eukprot:15449053-Alexandrium_andersonii.AAC.1